LAEKNTEKKASTLKRKHRKQKTNVHYKITAINIGSNYFIAVKVDKENSQADHQQIRTPNTHR
jgi:hypothetical protein